MKAINGGHDRFGDAYHVDLWEWARRRWMVGGVLAALALAVLAPAAGADGGPLRAQYVRYVPLGYIYWAAGRRGGGACGAGRRVLAVSCAHAALVAPALAVLLLASTGSAELHRSLVQGVLASSLGGGCHWLSLALCADAAAPQLAAAGYLVSLLTTPLAMLLLCGRAVVPGAGAGAGGACLLALGAFGAGAVAARRLGPPSPPAAGERAARLCALALLYMQCCDALAARGAVRLQDLFAVLLLELSWLAMSAGACWGYACAGVLAPSDARTVALCALPKGALQGWAAGVCGAARLPAVLLSPAQALLLAAIAPSPPSPPATP